MIIWKITTNVSFNQEVLSNSQISYKVNKCVLHWMPMQHPCLVYLTKVVTDTWEVAFHVLTKASHTHASMLVVHWVDDVTSITLYPRHVRSVFVLLQVGINERHYKLLYNVNALHLLDCHHRPSFLKQAHFSACTPNLCCAVLSVVYYTITMRFCAALVLILC